MSELLSLDWELDYYSRPILTADGKKRWELLICSTPIPGSEHPGFRQVVPCPAASVNSIWLREALEAALQQARQQGFAPPRRLRCWRPSMRTMVQRAAEGLGLELIPSRRTYALVEWLQQREREIYPAEEGYMAGPLAPPASPIRPVPVPLPEAARGERWAWATLPLGALADAAEWDSDFPGLVPLPAAAGTRPVVAIAEPVGADLRLDQLLRRPRVNPQVDDLGHCRQFFSVNCVHLSFSLPGLAARLGMWVDLSYIISIALCYTTSITKTQSTQYFKVNFSIRDSAAARLAA